MTLSPAKVSQVLTKPMPIMTEPQNRVIEDKNLRGPIFLQATVAGGWNITYDMKKTRVMMDCTVSAKAPVRLCRNSTYVSESDQSQFFVHPSDCGGGQVRAVHQRDTVHDSHCDDKSAIDAMNDLPLLGRRELQLALGSFWRLVAVHLAILDLLDTVLFFNILKSRHPGRNSVERWQPSCSSFPVMAKSRLSEGRKEIRRGG